MKQGHRYLYSNGRGNYWPIFLHERAYVKACEKRLKTNAYDYERGGDRNKKHDESAVKAHKHGLGLKQLCKGLNSKLRHMAKRQIRKELENYE